MPEDVVETTNAGVTTRYFLTGEERVLAIEYEGRTAAITVNRDGYAMLKVRTGVEGDELERYYGFDMALDHVADRLGIPPSRIPIPEPARDMGM